MEITCIYLRKILNSRGEETSEAVVFSDNGYGVGISPSGASISSKEAKIIDTDTGIKNFEKIKNNFIGEFSQEEFDNLLMKNINTIGANITTSLSFAFFNLEKYNFLGKLDEHIFPYPLGNVIGGGKHHGKTDIQEILILPANSKSVFEGIKTNFQIWKEIQEEYKNKFFGLNDEGALIMDFNNEDSLQIVKDISNKYKAKIGIDLAANELFDGTHYNYKNKKIDKEEQIDLVSRWIEDYKLYYVEDPFSENDFEGFEELTKRYKNKCLICGDDLIATQADKLDNKIINACIIKPNQVGTITGALKCIKRAKELNIVPVLSHRSGETCDTTISYLSLLTPIAKFGISQIRISKLNELIRLWDFFKDSKIAVL